MTARSASAPRRRIAATPPATVTTTSAGLWPACSASSAPASSRSPAAHRAAPSRPAPWRGRARGTVNRRWDLVEVVMTAKGQNRHLEGKSIEQIAREQNKSIMDAFLDLSLDEDLQTCFQTIDRNKDPATQKHILGSQYTV